MVYFVGAGPGDPDLITVKGKRKVDEADVIIYAGSLVNPQVALYTMAAGVSGGYPPACSSKDSCPRSPALKNNTMVV